MPLRARFRKGKLHAYRGHDASARKQKQPKARQKPLPSQPSGPKGWDAIQGYMLSHDEDMMGDFTDDVDTLLVFAGLFSAVLTAFLIVSIVLLQPDNSSMSIKLLSLIALQTGAASDVQPVLHSSALSTADSTSFEPSKTSIAINSLWSTSLVLSLTAALFGILAKQWCREYLRWHSAVASARQNVLLRQIRYEAWQDWHVPSYIACVPALLELAVPLFLAGLIVFTWTLNSVVAIVVTAMAGAALSAVFILTALPVMNRLCPLKSPTGWGFVKLAHLFRGSWARSRSTGKSDDLQDWRSRDLCVASEPSLELSLPMDSDSLRDIRNQTVVRSLPATIFADAYQTDKLVQALSWARKGSRDDIVFRNILESVPSVHSSQATESTDDSVALLLPSLHPSLFAVHRAMGVLHDPDGFMLRVNSCVLPLIGTQDLSIDCRSYHFRAFPDIGPWSRRGPYFYAGDAKNAVGVDDVALEIARKVLYADLIALADDWVRFADDLFDSPRAQVTAKIVELLCVLRCAPPLPIGGAVMQLDVEHWCQTLEAVFRLLAPHKAAYCDGIASMLLELCSLMGPVALDLEHDWVSVSKPTASARDHLVTVSTLAEFSIAIYRSSQVSHREDHTHLFVASVISVLEAMEHAILRRTPPLGPLETLAELLDCMSDAVERSLSAAETNCGAYIELPWITGFLEVYKTASIMYEYPYNKVPLTGEDSVLPKFLRLLDLLGMSIRRGLLSGDRVHSDYAELMEVLDRSVYSPQLPTSRPLAPDGTPLQWASDSIGRFAARPPGYALQTIRTMDDEEYPY